VRSMDALAVDALVALSEAVALVQSTKHAAVEPVVDATEIKPVVLTRQTSLLEVFVPTPGSVGLRLVTGILVAAGVMIVGGSFLIRVALGV